jgi:flavin reductase (DIM6/NTAB) family NADH-FMN oxidoreductase RutF
VSRANPAPRNRFRVRIVADPDAEFPAEAGHPSAGGFVTPTDALSLTPASACPRRQVTGPDYLVSGEAHRASPEDLRRTFRRHPAGVAVITANSASGPVGFTVTSLASVSAGPPRVSFNIAHAASSWPAVSRARYLGVHLLGAEQTELASAFARSGADRFAAPTVWAPGPRRVPVLDGCVSWMVAAVDARIPVGDHSIVVVTVLRFGGRADGGAPLLYHDGAYRQLAGHDDPEAARDRAGGAAGHRHR